MSGIVAVQSAVHFVHWLHYIRILCAPCLLGQTPPATGVEVSEVPTGMAHLVPPTPSLDSTSLSPAGVGV